MQGHGEKSDFFFSILCALGLRFPSHTGQTDQNTEHWRHSAGFHIRPLLEEGRPF
jgi:hypothetical protein